MDIFEADDNSTPLTAEEKNGLKLKWITLRSELNEAEARNIAQAQLWLAANKKKDVCSDTFLRNLHKKMFCDVWVWAGEYRITERNIGVAPYQIPMKLMQLFDDLNFWINNKTYSNHEIAVRLHHKLVQIHPFPNGNGRVSRLMADLVLQKLEGKTLYWGDTNLVDVSEVRRKYIDALRKADAGDYTDLLNFTMKKKMNSDKCGFIFL